MLYNIKEWVCSARLRENMRELWKMEDNAMTKAQRFFAYLKDKRRRLEEINQQAKKSEYEQIMKEIDEILYN